MNRLIAIIGPTASGKSDLAIEIARSFHGEIVNVDSRQFYRGMDIGTAKPTREHMSLLPHHLVDFLDPNDSFSLAGFLETARSLVDQINDRDALPVLVGGTGQYVWGLLEGWDVPSVPPNLEVRAQLEAALAKDGIAALAQRLRDADPTQAERTDLRNPRRVIRALERVSSGSAAHVIPRKSVTPPYNALIIGMDIGRERLHARIRDRVESMISRGWRAEVEQLLADGVSPDGPAMSAIGYREMVGHIQGELTIEQARHRTIVATNRLVRHQYNWFKRDDPRIHWIEAENGPGPVAHRLVEEWLIG